MFAVIKLAFQALPERYNPTLFTHIYEAFPSGFFVAEHNHNIVGFILGVQTVQNSAKILMIATSSHYRRKGIGSLLLKRFEQEIIAHGLSSITLEVHVDNTKAQQFYKRHGYVISETIQGFYQNGKNAFTLRKQV